MREAMIALAEGRTRQLLRGIIDLDHGNAFGVMPGAIDDVGFGAKLVSVFPGRDRSHQGAILLFDPVSGAPVAVVDAGEVTAIRTACASAAATDALARPDARRLAILGTGEQAWQHALAIGHVRVLDRIILWGRSPAKAHALAARLAARIDTPIEVASAVADAVGDADIICTTTGATDPILFSADVADGAHINLVGSSRAGPAEIDDALVARGLFFPDHRAGILVQGAEYLRARDAGLIGEAPCARRDRLRLCRHRARPARRERRHHLQIDRRDRPGSRLRRLSARQGAMPRVSPQQQDPRLLRRLLRARDRIDAASHELWPVARLANVSGVSEAHFSRSFRDAFGIPPHRYLLTRRVERAAALLRDTDLPIIDIAFGSGWNSLGSFGPHLSRRHRRKPGRPASPGACGAP